MDEKEPSPSVLAGVPDPAQASFVPILSQKRQVFALGVKLLVSAAILCYLVQTQRLGIVRIRDAWRARALTTVVVDGLFGVMGLVLAALGALVLKSHSISSGATLRSLELISSVARRSRPLGFCYR